MTNQTANRLTGEYLTTTNPTPASEAVPVLPPRAVILESLAGLGGTATRQQLAGVLGYRPDPAAVSGLCAFGLIRDAGGRLSLTLAGVRELARVHNTAARFVPADPGDVSPLEPDNQTGAGSLPGIITAGAHAFLYVNEAGVLCLSLHLDTGEIPGWLTGGPQEAVPVQVSVNGETVFAAREADAIGARL